MCENLHAEAGIAIENRAYSLEDVGKFQNYLEGKYQLVVISADAFNTPVYTGIYDL
jgi:ABC-type tungstate transport system permease subunit